MSCRAKWNVGLCMHLCVCVCVCVCVCQFKLTLAHDGSGQGAALVAATAADQHQKIFSHTSLFDNDVDQ